MATLYWCAGMYASGSTWAYNIMRGIAAALYAGQTVQGRFVNFLADLDGLDDDGRVHVVKTHDVAPEVTAELSRRATRLVVTIRDPRDAVTSMMLYQRYPFDMGLDWVARSAKFAASLALDPRALLLRYEAGFTDTPVTLDTIAQHFGGTLAADQRDRLFAQFTRSAVEGWISALNALPQSVRDARSGDVFDPETQWHRHHAGRTGEIGRWRRMLTPAQVAAVEGRMREWMAKFGYPTTIRGPGYTLRVGAFSLQR
jgi:hypothetical protein